MNDVEKGGATVFPFLNVALWPIKGAAAVWYNLHRSGEGDIRTKHAGCPVLAGSKWGRKTCITIEFKRLSNMNYYFSG